MFHYIIKAGTTDVSVVCRAIDSGDGTPETAFDHATSGIDLKYRREGAANVDITEAALAALTTAHTDGGVEQIGNGYFRLDLPDLACAAGATGVMVHGVATGMVVIGCYIQLVAYDPFDADRLGLTAPSDIESALVIAQSRLLVVKSDTSDISSSLVIVKSDLVVIDDLASDIHSSLVITKSQLLIVKSDTSDIKSSLVIALSDTAHIESDVALAETNISDIESSLVIAKSQLVVIKSDVAAIEAGGGALTAAQDSKLTKVTSDMIVVDDLASDIHSSLVITRSNLLIVKSDTSDIKSFLVVIDDLASDIKSELTKVYSDTTRIHSDTTAIEAAGGSLSASQDSKLTRIASDQLLMEGNISDIESSLVIVKSDTAHIESDAVLAETNISDIESSLVIAKSQILIAKSDTSDIRSFLVVIDDLASDIHSSLVIAKSQLLIVKSDTSDIKSSLVIALSDTAHIESDAVALDAALNAARGDPSALAAELAATLTLKEKVDWLFAAALRDATFNKTTGVHLIKNQAGTDIAKATASDDGTTTQRGEFGAP